MRTIIVGDVHGCFQELLMLLDKISYQKDFDRLIFVGDLINKGPESLNVLNFVRQQEAEVVLGNHELAFIRGVQDPNKAHKYIAKLIAGLGIETCKFWVEWLLTFPLFIEEDDFIVVHAGLEPQVSLAKQKSYVLTAIRTWDGQGVNLNSTTDLPWWHFYKEKKLVVYGHWAAQGLNLQTNSIGLDSGCVYGKQLSALILPQKQIVQVDAQKVYVPISNFDN